VYVAPGNAGTALEDGLENIELHSVDELLAFALREHVYLTVVGPEAPLAAGVVDAFRAAGLKIFGPTKLAANWKVPKISPKHHAAAPYPTALYQPSLLH